MSGDQLTYPDGREYDRTSYAGLWEVKFYYSLAKRSQGPTLELGGGTGRITVPLAKGGIRITSIDNSQPMIDEGRRHAKREGVQVRWVLADCLTFELGMKFGLIFLTQNSLHHFQTLKELEKFFDHVRLHLAPGGRFAFDVLNPLTIKCPQELRPHAVELPENYNRFEGQGAYESASENGTKFFHFYPSELEAVCRRNGFEVVEKYGNFGRKHFEPTDYFQVLVCK